MTTGDNVRASHEVDVDGLDRDAGFNGNCVRRPGSGGGGTCHDYVQCSRHAVRSCRDPCICYSRRRPTATSRQQIDDFLVVTGAKARC